MSSQELEMGGRLPRRLEVDREQHVAAEKLSLSICVPDRRARVGSMVLPPLMEKQSRSSGASSSHDIYGVTSHVTSGNPALIRNLPWP